MLISRVIGGALSGSSSLRLRRALPALALIVAGACGGNAFTRAEPSGDGGDATDGQNAAGSSSRGGVQAGGEAGTGGTAQGSGADGLGGSAGMSGDGAASNAGAAGQLAAADCLALDGKPFEDHCYVEGTSDSLTQPLAERACATFAQEAGRTGYLLVLNTAEEQAFVVREFLEAFADSSDAWLGLTCRETTHPDYQDCYCKDCDAESLLQKQQNWKWLSSSASTFGWVNQNPNGGGRCAALGFNSVIMAWGWVDRDCDASSFQLNATSPAHHYLSICEIE